MLFAINIIICLLEYKFVFEQWTHFSGSKHVHYQYSDPLLITYSSIYDALFILEPLHILICRNIFCNSKLVILPVS